MKKLLQILTVLIIVVGIIMLAFSYVATIVYAEEGYPAPIDYGYPVQWYPYNNPSYPAPIDYGYPIGYPVDDGYPVGYPIDTGYPIDGYPIDDGYPVEIVSEPTEWQAEIQEIKEVIENIQPFEKSKAYQTWQQVKEIVKVYFGKMIKFSR